MRLVKDVRQGALIRLERSSEYWCLPLNPGKYKASFFSVDSHQANLQPNLCLFNTRFRFNPTSTFLGVTFHHTLSFSKHVSSLKTKFFHFLCDRCACVVYQNHKSRSFQVRRSVPQGFVLGPILFSLFINDLPASLPSVSCSLYADDLAICSSFPSVPTAVVATQGALFR